MAKQTFKTVDVLKLEVEATPTGTVNLVQNPSGELGGWGWLTPVAGSLLRGTFENGLSWLKYTAIAGANHFTTEAFGVAVGQYVSARFRLTAAQYIRVRVEWLNSAGAVISSSAQSSYITTGGSMLDPPTIVTYTSNAAPASTVKARLRIDFYRNTSGGNPLLGDLLRLREVAVIKTASATPSVVRTNLCTNPSMETNATGWSASTNTTATRTTAQGHTGSASLAVAATNAFSLGQTWRNVTLAGGADASGRTFTASAYVRAATVPRNATMSLRWKDSGGAILKSGSASGTTVADSVGGWTRISVTATAPSLAVTADFFVTFEGMASGEVHYVDAVLVEESSVLGTYFDGATTDTASVNYAWSGTAHASTSTATSITSDFGYIEPATYVNVLGPSHSISVKRTELNVGILTAEILDAALDPSQFDLIRPGKRVRLMALDDTTDTWTPIFTGKVSRGETKYDPRRTDAKRARINLTALDAATTLAQVSRDEGVATIADLPYLLEGAGVPWSVNGSGNQVGTATVVTTNPNASALDQVAITRDSVLGYAWVDRRGVLQVWDRTSIAATPAATLDEATYSGFEMDYDTDRCINTVTVKLRRVNVANGQTVEVTYGPFVDQASVDQWGPHSAEFTVQGITDSEAAASAYAAPILAANATPAVRVNSVQLPIMQASHIAAGRALLDLYDLVTVENDNAAISHGMRITGLEHRIEPEKWMLSLDFTVAGSVATPQAAPAQGVPVAEEQFGGGVIAFTGPYGTTVPGPTTGTAITLPGGVLRAVVNTTAFGVASTGLAVEVYWDGVLVGTMRLNPTHAVSQHTALSAVAFEVDVTAGTHYLGLRTTAGSTNADDFGSFMGVVTPS